MVVFPCVVSSCVHRSLLTEVADVRRISTTLSHSIRARLKEIGWEAEGIDVKLVLSDGCALVDGAASPKLTYTKSGNIQ